MAAVASSVWRGVVARGGRCSCSISAPGKAKPPSQLFFFSTPFARRISYAIVRGAARQAATGVSSLTPRQPSVYAYVRELARRGTPTLLFEAPSHRWLFFGSWTSGIFCYCYAAYHLVTIYANPPEGMFWWVPKAFAVICVSMACVGTFFIMRSSHIIHTIRALPVAATGAAGKGSLVQAHAVPSGAAMQSTKMPALDLEITIKSIFPFQKPKIIKVPHGAVSIEGYQTPTPVVYVTESERIAQKQLEAEQARQRRQYELDHLYTAPFRHAARGAREAYHGIRRSLMGSGFATLKIEGQGQYKLDAENGWMLNNGLVLSRIVRITEPSDSAWLRLYRS